MYGKVLRSQKSNHSIRNRQIKVIGPHNGQDATFVRMTDSMIVKFVVYGKNKGMSSLKH